MAINIQIRGDNSSNWSTANPVLADREIAYDKDIKQLKIGNGANSWNNLPFYGVGTGFSGTNVSGTINSNGIQLSAGAGGGGGSDGVNIVQMGTTGTTGTSYSASTGTIFFNGSNNVTVSQNNSNQMVIIGPTLTQYLTTAQPPGAYLTTASPVAHSHNFATTVTAGSVVNVGTTNSAGVTVGMPAFITTAMGSNEAHIQAAIYSNVTQTSGSLYFSGSGGITVGSGAGGTVIISFDGHHIDAVLPSGNGYGTGFSSMSSGTFGINAVGALSMSQNANNLSFSVPAQTVQTQTAGNLAGTGFTSTTVAGTAIAVTHNGAGISLAQPLFLTTAANSTHVHGFATTTTNGAVAVVGTNNSAGVTLAMPAWITTYVAQTTQTQPAGNIAGVGTTFAGTNITATMGNNSNGLALSLSVAAPGGGGGAALQGSGTYTQNTGTVQFANSNNITFGLSNNGVMSASFSQSVDTGRAGLGTTYAGTNINATMAMGSNGLGLSLSAGAGGAGDGVNIVQMGTTGTTGTSFSASTGTVFFNGSNNITVSQNNSNQMVIVGPTLTQYLTTARASNDAIGLNTALTANGVSWTVNSGGLSMNVPAFLTTAAASNKVYGFATTTTNGSVANAATVNSAGVTLANPPWITTYAAQTNQTVASGNIAGVGTTFAGTNATATMGLNSNGLAFSLSVAAGGAVNQTGPNIAVAGTTVTAGTVYFSNSPTVTFGMDGASNLTASAAGGGGGAATIGGYELFPPLGGNTAFSTGGLGTIYFQKFIAPANISFNNIERRLSGSTVSSAISAQAAHTISYGLYSAGTGTQTSIYNLIASSSMFMQASYSSNLSAGHTISQGAGSYTASSAGTVGQGALTGFKHIYFPFTSTITAGGNYAFAMNMSSATTGATGPLRIGFQELSVINNLTVGKVYASTVLATNASFVGDYAQGVYSSSSNGLPSTLAISGLTNAVSQQRMYFQFEA